MAVVAKHGKNTSVLIDGFNLDCIWNDASNDRTVEMADITGFGDGTDDCGTDMKFLPGQRMGTMDFSGFWVWDGTTGTTESSGKITELINAALGSSSQIITYAPAGRTAGDPAVLGDAVGNSFAITSPANGAVAASASMQLTDIAPWGKIIDPLGVTVSTTATTGATVTFPTTGSKAGYVMHLQVFGGSSGAGTDLAIVMQDSSDASVWANLPTQFADVDSTGPIHEAQRVINTAAPTERHIRANITPGSTGISYTIALARIA